MLLFPTHYTVESPAAVGMCSSRLLSELGSVGGPGRSTIKQMSVWYWFALRWQFLSLSEQQQLLRCRTEVLCGTAVGWKYKRIAPVPTSPPQKAKKRGPVKWQRGRGGGGGGVRDVNHKPATSAGKWMALICISSCMIHQHHFTTVQNITFILQMLIYDKQLIWETSDLRSIKDPLTFIFFCLKKWSVFVWASASMHAHTHPVPLGFHLSVCWVCASACVR